MKSHAQVVIIGGGIMGVSLRYHLIKEGNGKPKFDLTMLGDTRIDRQWVETLISDIRNKMFTKLCKEDYLKCNGLWRTYA